ncbi:MAG: 50S ribosomal protein L13 [Candidatus Omnitrophica bacterium]|nr:50S ribosomal protein L13 [Candidatus Omnitrophota bacterium]
MKTYIPSKDTIKRHHYFVDAKDKILGRIATGIATTLSGKNKPIYTPNIDTGDYVIVLNADKVRVTGKKDVEKIYKTYSGYPSGLREYNFETFLSRKPKGVIWLAVKNMLPKSKMGKRMLGKLKIYTASEKPNLPKNAKELKV